MVEFFCVYILYAIVQIYIDMPLFIRTYNAHINFTQIKCINIFVPLCRFPEINFQLLPLIVVEINH